MMMDRMTPKPNDPHTCHSPRTTTYGAHSLILDPCRDAWIQQGWFGWMYHNAKTYRNHALEAKIGFYIPINVKVMCIIAWKVVGPLEI